MVRMLEKILKEKSFDIFYNLNRWNGSRVVNRESVAAHSYFVVFVVRIMVEYLFVEDKDKLRLTDKAMLHDFDETYDFDINHKIKHNDWNGKQIRDCIDMYCNFMFDKDFPEDSWLRRVFKKEGIYALKDELDSAIIKIADWYSCIFYLRKEIGMGNKQLMEEYGRSLIGFKNSCQLLEDISSGFNPDQLNKEFIGELIQYSQNLISENYVG